MNTIFLYLWLTSTFTISIQILKIELLTNSCTNEHNFRFFLCCFLTLNTKMYKQLRYYNREAVVISALQVEKHPLTTPGPFSTPPPPGRHNMTQMGVNSLMSMTPPLGRFDATSRTGSPIPRPGSCASGSYGSPRVGEAFRSSPKPHSSPKMKLRWFFLPVFRFPFNVLFCFAWFFFVLVEALVVGDIFLCLLPQCFYVKYGSFEGFPKPKILKVRKLYQL